MIARTPVIVLALVAAGLTAAAAQAGSTFAGNTCGLLSAKQVTSIAGVLPACKNAKPLPGAGAMTYVGNWAGKTTRSPHVQVTVSAYNDATWLALAKRNLGQGLVAAGKRIQGIGTAAVEASGPGATDVRFAKGKTIVLVNVTGMPKTWSAAAVESLAKDIAARL